MSELKIRIWKDERPVWDAFPEEVYYLPCWVAGMGPKKQRRRMSASFDTHAEALAYVNSYWLEELRVARLGLKT